MERNFRAGPFCFSPSLSQRQFPAPPLLDPSAPLPPPQLPPLYSFLGWDWMRFLEAYFFLFFSERPTYQNCPLNPVLFTIYLKTACGRQFLPVSSRDHSEPAGFFPSSSFPIPNSTRIFSCGLATSPLHSHPRIIRGLPPPLVENPCRSFLKWRIVFLALWSFWPPHAPHWAWFPLVPLSHALLRLLY